MKTILSLLFTVALGLGSQAQTALFTFNELNALVDE